MIPPPASTSGFRAFPTASASFRIWKKLPLVRGMVARQAGRFRVGVAGEDLGQHVHRHVHGDRAGPAAAGDMEGVLEDLGKLFDVGDQVVMLADRPGQTGHVRFLKSVGPDARGSPPVR